MVIRKKFSRHLTAVEVLSLNNFPIALRLKAERWQKTSAVFNYKVFISRKKNWISSTFNDVFVYKILSLQNFPLWCFTKQKAFKRKKVDWSIMTVKLFLSNACDEFRTIRSSRFERTKTAFFACKSLLFNLLSWLWRKLDWSTFEIEK